MILAGRALVKKMQSNSPAPAALDKIADGLLAEVRAERVDAVTGVPGLLTAGRIALLLAGKAGDCDLHFRD